MQAVISMYSWTTNLMSKSNFRQAAIEYELKFLKENMEVAIMMYQGETLGVELPNTVELRSNRN